MVRVLPAENPDAGWLKLRRLAEGALLWKGGASPLKGSPYRLPDLEQASRASEDLRYAGRPWHSVTSARGKQGSSGPILAYGFMAS